MLARAITTASAILALSLSGMGIALAFDAPAAQCSLNADKSSLVLIASNSGSRRLRLHRLLPIHADRPAPAAILQLQLRSCRQHADKVACQLDGNGPAHFAEIRPTKFVCQPR